MHRTLSKAFGDDTERYASARVLFRVDYVDEGRTAFALVQSVIVPDWSAVSAKPGYLAEGAVVKTFAPAFHAGQRLAFRLRANPTVARDGKRHGLYQEEECLLWMHRKGQTSGFGITRLAMQPPVKVKCRTAGGGDATLSSVLFDGGLIVNDPARFGESLRAGIGAAKGFGFGLLSLARG